MQTRRVQRPMNTRAIRPNNEKRVFRSIPGTTIRDVLFRNIDTASAILRSFVLFLLVTDVTQAFALLAIHGENKGRLWGALKLILSR
jgi:hypothetical protein